MPLHGKRLLLTFCFLVVICGAVFSQAGQHLRLRSGGTVPFTINSFTRYNNGVELNEWSRFRVNIFGLADTDNWRLEVSTNSPVIRGDNLFNLDLDYLRIKAEAINIVPVGTNIFYYPEHPGFTGLSSDPPVVLLSGTGNVQFDLFISYSLGTENPLLGQQPDIYFVDIYFDLKANN